MRKFNTDFVVSVSVICEIQANSIEEAKSLVEDEITYICDLIKRFFK